MKRKLEENNILTHHIKLKETTNIILSKITENLQCCVIFPVAETVIVKIKNDQRYGTKLNGLNLKKNIGKLLVQTEK